MGLRSFIRTIPDFPSPGIQFRDITSLLCDAAAYRHVIDRFLARYRTRDLDAVVGIESRGFIFAPTLAYLMELPLIPIRREGKLPHTKLKQEYALECGNKVVGIHTDAPTQGQRALVVADLLAMGEYATRGQQAC
jgi:adenine phosphoribosyltransferase